MKKRPLHLKEIDPKEREFFWFNLGQSTYVLYDSDLGEPISYGSINLVVGTIRAINEEVISGKRNPCVLWYFERDGTIGWRKKTPPVLFNWNPSAATKKAVADDKKTERPDSRT